MAGVAGVRRAVVVRGGDGGESGAGSFDRTATGVIEVSNLALIHLYILLLALRV